MRKQQQGMTAIGVVLVLLVLGSIGFGVIQLVPVYLENMRIVQVMNQVKADLEGQNATVTDIRKALGRRVNIEDLRDVNHRKDFVVKRSASGYKISIEYERRKVYFGNVYLLAEFDHTVEIFK
ncbi:MAG: DUF4845 domain-containing protein [Gammaproteobacteria bacterium]|jgi:hypothetical protein|nr:DUF4845 domain-containing protein [Gammaproteobacteria bacterium]MDP6615842.1 DUF4845 domain-containing protein [Gammaproteobacteria bacterium]MDP6694340.1 DUF4845 domain-containing protein [Gammaproteobacteria bacterium]